MEATRVTVADLLGASMLFFFPFTHRFTRVVSHQNKLMVRKISGIRATYGLRRVGMKHATFRKKRHKLQKMTLLAYTFCARQHICYSAHMLSSVRLSVTQVDQSKTLEVRIIPMTLVSSRLTSSRNSKRNIGSEGAK